jgi:NADPH-dependent curcumin reductase CurA
MRGRGVGIVVASRNPAHPVGEIVQGKLGWQEYAVSDGSPYYMMYRIEQRCAPLSTGIGVLGVTGFTSYLGLADVGAAKKGRRAAGLRRCRWRGFERRTDRTRTRRESHRGHCGNA